MILGCVVVFKKKMKDKKETKIEISFQVIIPDIK